MSSVPVRDSEGFFFSEKKKLVTKRIILSQLRTTSAEIIPLLYITTQVLADTFIV